jgi:hypothetical protein
MTLMGNLRTSVMCMVLSTHVYASDLRITFKSQASMKPNVILEYSDMEVIYDGPNTLRVEIGGIKIQRKIRLVKPKTFDLDFTDKHAYRDRYFRKTRYSPH